MSLPDRSGATSLLALSANLNANLAIMALAVALGADPEESVDIAVHVRLTLQRINYEGTEHLVLQEIRQELALRRLRQELALRHRSVL